MNNYYNLLELIEVSILLAYTYLSKSNKWKFYNEIKT